MQVLKRYFFNKTLKKQLSESLNTKAFIPYNKAKSVLILFESDLNEENNHIKNMIKQLTDDGKKVVAWGFISAKAVKSIITPDFMLFNKNSFNWYGKPNPELIEQIEAQSFDLLIDLSYNRICQLLYVGLFSKAHFKIGSNQSDIQLFDFTINTDLFVNNLIEEIGVSENEEAKNEELIKQELSEFLFEQIIFYLKKIETKD